jgi:hypothetical protein
MTSLHGLKRVDRTLNPNYKRSGPKSYAWLLQVFSPSMVRVILGNVNINRNGDLSLLWRDLTSKCKRLLLVNIIVITAITATSTSFLERRLVPTGFWQRKPLQDQPAKLEKCPPMTFRMILNICMFTFA